MILAGRSLLAVVPTGAGESPQQLQRARWQTTVADEAYCVSLWGHDFRPEYRQLPAACEQLGIQQDCAFTATATPEVRQHILRGLRLSHAQRPFARPATGFSQTTWKLPGRVFPVESVPLHWCEEAGLIESRRPATRSRSSGWWGSRLPAI